MPGKKERSGGARKGSGPVRRRFVLSHGIAVLLRELARSEHKRKEVTEAELATIIERLIIAAADARIATEAPDQD